MVKTKKKAKLLALIPIVFFSVSGGPFGLEEIISSVGPINTILLIVLLPIVWTIPECFIVAELSSSYPVQGGYYRWVQMSLGRFWGFMEGWWSILYTLVDLSLYPILITTYLKILLPQLDFTSIYLIQLSVIWSSALINIFGIRIVGNLLTLFQAIIMLLFVFFVVIGLGYISFDFSSILQPTDHYTTKNLLLGLSIAFWNFIGWDNGSTVLHEIDKPETNYHKALFLTIPIIVAFYLFPILVGLCIHTDWDNWRFGEFSYIADSMHKPWLSVSLALGGMITCLGLFNSMLLTSTRVISEMANDKLLPAKLAELHDTYQTPYISIIFSAFVYSLLVLCGFHNLITYDVFLYLIALLLEAIALIVLRKRNPGKKVHFKIPFGYFGMYFIVGVAVVVIMSMVVINLLSLNGTDAYLNIFLLLSGVPVYLLYEKCFNPIKK